MTPELFIAHQTDHGLTERQGYQRHFADLCALAHFAIPRDPAAFTYEKQVTKLGGQRGGRGAVGADQRRTRLLYRLQPVHRTGAVSAPARAEWRFHMAVAPLRVRSA